MIRCFVFMSTNPFDTLFTVANFSISTFDFFKYSNSKKQRNLKNLCVYVQCACDHIVGNNAFNNRKPTINFLFGPKIVLILVLVLNYLNVKLI